MIWLFLISKFEDWLEGKLKVMDRLKMWKKFVTYAQNMNSLCNRLDFEWFSVFSKVYSLFKEYFLKICHHLLKWNLSNFFFQLMLKYYSLKNIIQSIMEDTENYLNSILEKRLGSIPTYGGFSKNGNNATRLPKRE